MASTNLPKPRYTDVHPPELATFEELQAAGLKPGPGEPVALFAYQRGTTSGLCSLFEWADALPDGAVHADPS